YYHIINQGIEKQTIFKSKRDYKRLILTLDYYRYDQTRFSLSAFIKKSTTDQAILLSHLKKTEPLVNILAYCLLPNHFHLLLQQVKDNGVPSFIGQVENSYTKYFNHRHDHKYGLLNDVFVA